MLVYDSMKSNDGEGGHVPSFIILRARSLSDISVIEKNWSVLWKVNWDD